MLFFQIGETSHFQKIKKALLGLDDIAMGQSTNPFLRVILLISQISARFGISNKASAKTDSTEKK